MTFHDDLMRQIDSILGPYRRMQEQLDNMLGPVRQHQQQFERMLEPYRRQQEQMLGAVRSLGLEMPTGAELYALSGASSAAVREIQSLSAVTDSLLEKLAPYKDVSRHFEEMTGQWRATETMTSPAWAGLARAEWTARSSQLLTALDATGIIRSSQELSNRLLQPLHSNADFLRETVDLARTAPVGVSEAISAAVADVQRQFGEGVDALGRVLASPVDYEAPSLPRDLKSARLYRELMIESARGTSPREERAWGVLPAIRRESVRLIRLVAECNEMAKLKGREEIFKPTTRMLVAVADLACLVMTDLEDLAEVADALFFMLYEGAGTDHLRFLRSEGGPMESPECEAVWAIKALRVWRRHDPDHGDEKKITKEWRDLSAYLSWLGIGTPPVTDLDFMSLHLAVINKACAFLEDLKLRLAQPK